MLRLSVLLVLGLAGDLRGPESGAPELHNVGYLQTPVVSADRSRLVSWSGERAWLFDVEDGSAMLAIGSSEGSKQGDPWEGARFSNDGKRLVLWALRGTVALVDVEEATVLWRTEMLAPSGFVTTRADGSVRHLAQHDGKRVVLWSLEHGGPQELASFDIQEDWRLPPWSRSLALDEGGHLLAFGGIAGVDVVQVADSASETRKRIADDGWRAVTFLSSDSSLLIAKLDLLRRVDARDGRVLATRSLRHGLGRFVGIDLAQTRALFVDSDSNLVAVEPLSLEVRWTVPKTWTTGFDPAAEAVYVHRGRGDNGMLDLADGEELWKQSKGSLSEQLRYAESVGVGAYVMERGGVLVCVDARAGTWSREIRPLRGEPRWAGMLTNDVAWVLSKDGQLRRVGAADGRLLSEQQVDFEPVAASARGKHIVLLAPSGRARVYNSSDLEPLGEFDGGDEILVSRDGERALTTGDANFGARIVALPEGDLLRKIAIADQRLGQVTWSEDSSLVAAIDDAHKPHLWSRNRELALPEIDAARSVALDPKGRWLAVGIGGPRVLVFDANNGEEIVRLSLKGTFIFDAEVRTLAFDPLGEHLVATTGDAGTVQAWRCEDWSHSWFHEYGGGNPFELHLAIDDVSERVWVWGMTGATPAAFDLVSGEMVAALSGSDLEGFSPAPDGRTIAALRGGALILLEVDGRPRVERIDLGQLGVVLSLSQGGVSGAASALPHVFAKSASGEYLRADRLVEEQRSTGR